MKSIGTCPACKKPIDPARGIYTIGENDYHPKCDEKRQAESARPALDQDQEPAGEVFAVLLTAITEGQEDPSMTRHATIGVLVAVRLPVWPVVEQIFTWRGLNAAGSPQHAEGQLGTSNAPGTPAEVSPVTRATSSAALRARGATIYAEVAGYAMTGDTYNIMAPRPGGVGMAKTMRMALASAGIAKERVGYINTHASSTQLGDKYETAAIKDACDDCASGIPVSSNYTPDPELDLDYVPNDARECDVNIALSNSFAFGGCSATLVFRKCAEGRPA